MSVSKYAEYVKFRVNYELVCKWNSCNVLIK